MAVNCIRQRKQWTADLSTLTDGVANWPFGAGTPNGVTPFQVSAYAVSGNGNKIDGAVFSLDWQNVQNPRYEKLRARFVLTGTGPTITQIFQLSLFMGVAVDDTAVGGTSCDETLEVDVTPSARPTDFSIGVIYDGTYDIGDDPPAFSGTITFTFL
jgi:hypothetical protein